VFLPCFFFLLPLSVHCVKHLQCLLVDPVISASYPIPPPKKKKKKKLSVGPGCPLVALSCLPPPPPPVMSFCCPCRIASCSCFCLLVSSAPGMYICQLPRSCFQFPLGNCTQWPLPYLPIAPPHPPNSPSYLQVTLLLCPQSLLPLLCPSASCPLVMPATCPAAPCLRHVCQLPLSCLLSRVLLLCRE
jgi:hypothetical protein